MYTNNYNAMLRSVMTERNRNWFKIRRGTFDFYGYNTIKNGFKSYNSEESNYFGVLVGTGTTEPSYMDYILENEDTNLTYIGSHSTDIYNVDEAATDDDYRKLSTLKSVSSTFRNDTDSDIVISEIGLFFAYNRSLKSDDAFLVAREVLENPITVKPHTIESFTMVMGV